MSVCVFFAGAFFGEKLNVSVKCKGRIGYGREEMHGVRTYVQCCIAGINVYIESAWRRATAGNRAHDDAFVLRK